MTESTTEFQDWNKEYTELVWGVGNWDGATKEKVKKSLLRLTHILTRDKCIMLDEAPAVRAERDEMKRYIARVGPILRRERDNRRQLCDELADSCSTLIQVVEQLVPEESVRGVANLVLFQAREAIAKHESMTKE